ncbi:MAG: TonB-dependent receptor [Bacteroidota bacterium]|nr:TonB-dependent receptor [Bacteroidota bacterium]MDP4190526.1 TonB-dependent receptor [Bacteroidota bacterium]MDP4193671.1 TonB-dependent receptor [Bacteroidota bacterium]
MKFLSKGKLLFLFLPLFASTITLAQGGLRGTIKDSLTNTPLVGASIYIKGTSLGAATDVEGLYKIPRIPEGSYFVRISYIGYKTKEVIVDIREDQAKEFNELLTPDFIEGATVLVTGQALGQAAAINQQVRSNTIINVVSEEKIQELPDANAAEAIGRLPGVALQRSGGEANKIVMRGMSDKFGTVTVDGIRLAPTDADSRGVDLSTVSQGSLAGIELFKALTPDKDADAIAGSVNLVTKKAPEKRLLRLDAKGIYNQLDNTAKQYDFTLRYGERFFSDILGLQLSGNIERRNRSNENIGLAYNQNFDGKGTNYIITDFNVNYRNEIRKRGGLSLLFDVNTPEGGTIRLSGIYNKTNRDYTLYNRNYPYSTEVVYNAQNVEQEINTFNSSLRGDNNLFGFETNWGLSFAQSKGDNPYDYSLQFNEPSLLDNSGNPVSGMNTKTIPTLKDSPEKLIPYALNNFSKATLNWAFFRTEYNIDKEKTAFVDVSRKYTLSDDLAGEFKFGGKYRYKNRFKQSTENLSPYITEPFRKYYIASDGSVQIKNFAGTYFENLFTDGGKILFTNFLDPTPVNRNLYSKYELNPLVNPDKLRQWYELNKNGVATLDGKDAEYKTNLEVQADYYDIVERISAAYLMNTFNIGEFATVIAGLRVENEKNDYLSKYSKGALTGYPAPSGQLRDTLATHNETIWLPNVNLVLRPTEYLNIRLAAYKALARPDFNQRLANFVARTSGTTIPGITNNVVLSIGNPNLRSAQAWNFEVNTSLFSNDLGLFSVSAFYKEIKDMFHMVNGLQVSAKSNEEKRLFDSLGIKAQSPFVQGTLYALTTPYNSGKPTKVWGFEVEHQARMKFLPGYLQNIVLSYNFSVVRSETYVLSSETRIDSSVVIIRGKEVWHTFPVTVNKETKQKLEGQPEFFGNIAFGYELGGFSARLSFFYNGEFNTSFTPDNRTNIVQGRYTKWDLAVKQDINRNVSLFFNLNNFTNVEEFTNINNKVTGWNLLQNSQRYDMTGDLGVRVTL